jgi:antitoxin VapB
MRRASVALHIASERVDRLARELASVTGERLTTAVERALEQRLERVRSSAVDPERAERVARLRETLLVWREKAGVDGTAAPTKEEYDELWGL